MVWANVPAADCEQADEMAVNIGRNLGLPRIFGGPTRYLPPCQDAARHTLADVERA